MYFSIKRQVEPIEDAYPPITYTIAGIVTFLFWAYHVYLEIRQFGNKMGLKNNLKYLKDFWNFNDLIHLGITLISIISNVTEEPMLHVKYSVVLAAVGSLCICIKFFDWLRLFDKTSVYINLIGMTILEVQYFFILLVASMLMFGFPLLMLNLYRTADYSIFERNSYYQIISMILH